MKPIQQTVLAFAASALVSFALRTHDLFFVDGAARCLTVFQHPILLFHPNNHLLFLVDVLAWTKLAAALGFNLSDPLSFVLAVDTMNGLAAAVCIAILYWIVLRITSSWKLTAAICVGYGFTTSFLAQATNPNEPMVGAAWSFLAVLFGVIAVGNQRIWPLVVSGVFFALSMATYRSMVLLAPATAVLLVFSVDTAKSSRVWQMLRLAVLGIAYLAGCALIFGWAYSHMGVSRADMPGKFLHQEDAAVYFDPSLSQWLKLPLGLVRNCFPILPEYNGMRGFLASPKSVLIPVIFLVAALCSALLYCGYTLAKRRTSLNSLQRLAVISSFAGLLFTMIPLVTWNPHYGKFWIQPLACLAVLAAIAFRHFSEASASALTAARIAGVLFLVGVAFNLTWAFRNHFHEPYEFEEAHKVTQYVGDKDFVVLERGSDSVSVMYAYLWADERQIFPVIDRATVRRMGILRDLHDEILKTRSAGGKVYFLGVLDTAKPTWDAFLGKRCGVPYETFDRYREAAQIKAQFKSRGGPTYLWELTYPAEQSPAAAAQPPRS